MQGSENILGRSRQPPFGSVLRSATRCQPLRSLSCPPTTARRKDFIGTASQSTAYILNSRLSRAMSLSKCVSPSDKCKIGPRQIGQEQSSFVHVGNRIARCLLLCKRLSSSLVLSFPSLYSDLPNLPFHLTSTFTQFSSTPPLLKPRFPTDEKHLSILIDYQQ